MIFCVYIKLNNKIKKKEEEKKILVKIDQTRRSQKKTE